MSEAYDDVAYDRNVMPRAVRAMRVLMFVMVGATALVLIGGLILAAGDAEATGEVVGVCLPGLVTLVLAVLLSRRGRVLWWCVVALEGISILVSLLTLLGGDPRGLTSMVLPVVILVLALRRTSRAWFRAG